MIQRAVLLVATLLLSACKGGTICGTDGESCFTACNVHTDCGEAPASFCEDGACKTSECGDGVVQGREVCDLGVLNADNGPCRTDCQLAKCGDGILHIGVEACDDGNTIDGDGCNAICNIECQPYTTPTARCDGINCDDDAQCRNACINGTCWPVSTAGGPCDSSPDCDASLDCSDGSCRLGDGRACTDDLFCANTCIGQVCAPFALVGEPCDTADDCEALSSCDTGACIALAGVACSYNRDCSDVCILLLCTSPSPTGGSCDQDADCTIGNFCHQGRCLLTDGSSCSADNECVETCRGTCGPFGNTGETCDDTADCAGQHTCTGGVCVKDPGARVCGDGVPDPGEFCFPYIIDAPTYVRHMRGADFNGDGYIDIVIAEAQLDRVHVMLARGDGTYEPPQAISPGAPRWISIADLDLDGDLDIAVAHPSDSRIITHPGNGLGAFLTATALNLDVDPQYLTAGDLDGDLAPELVVVVDTPPSIVIMNNDGSGSFVTGDTYIVGASPMPALVIDVDLDGDRDVVVPEYADGWINVFLNDGAGALSSPLLLLGGVGPRRVAVADFDGDGVPDLATANKLSEDISLFSGNGDGTFRLIDSLAAAGNPVELRLEDWNRDGDVDVALITTAGAITWWAGDGAGGFVEQDTFVASRDASAMALGRVDGDPYPDLLIAHSFGSGGVTVLLGVAVGSFNGIQVSGGQPVSDIAVGDLDKDGAVDIVGSYSSSSYLFTGNGDGTFQPATTLNPAGGPLPLVADLDGDTMLDIMDFYYGDYHVFWGNGDGTYVDAGTTTLSNGFSRATLTDLDGNGTLDVVGPGRTNGTLLIMFNSGGRMFQAPVETATTLDADVVATGDVDGNGYPDLLLLENFPERISLRLGLGDGAGGLSLPEILDYGSRLGDAKIADLDGDTFDEIILTDRTADLIAVFSGGPSGALSTPTEFTGIDDPRKIEVFDGNYDGFIDVVVTTSRQHVTFLPGDGAGNLGAPRRLSAVRTPTDVLSSDVDGDGHPDLIISHSNGLTVLLSRP